MEMKIFDYVLEIDILRNSSPKFLGVLRGELFKGTMSKKTPRRPAG